MVLAAKSRGRERPAALVPRATAPMADDTRRVTIVNSTSSSLSASRKPGREEIRTYIHTTYIHTTYIHTYI